MNTKICNKCQKEQSVENYHKASRNVDGLYHTCKTCRTQIDKNYYLTSDKKPKLMASNKKNRKDFREEFHEFKRQQGCSLCSENEPYCLDYHHLRDKTMAISQMVKLGFSFENILKEIEKCILLCANCHRKVHAGILKI